MPTTTHADYRAVPRTNVVRKAGRPAADVLRQAVSRIAPLGEPFHLSDLVLAAWRLDPDRFGLEGYERQFPDSNRVNAEVRDRRPKKFGRELERVGPNRFRLKVVPS